MTDDLKYIICDMLDEVCPEAASDEYTELIKVRLDEIVSMVQAEVDALALIIKP